MRVIARTRLVGSRGDGHKTDWWINEFMDRIDMRILLPAAGDAELATSERAFVWWRLTFPRPPLDSPDHPAFARPAFHISLCMRHA